MNIIRRLALSALLALAAAPISFAADWKPLFNGKDLTGWTEVGGHGAGWKVEDGILYGAGEGGWLSTADEYDNFELELEFKLPAGGNSGVFLRAPHEGLPWRAGMELQILDDRDKQYANIKPYQRCGSLYDLVPAPPSSGKPAGEWQKYHITCDHRKVKAELNGAVTVDVDLDTLKDDQQPKHPGIHRTKGYIGLQNHGSRTDFRNIRIRTLK